MSSYFAMGAGWPITPMAVSLCQEIEKDLLIESYSVIKNLFIDQKLFNDRRFILDKKLTH